MSGRDGLESGASRRSGALRARQGWWFRRALWRRLEALREGELVLSDARGVQRFGTAASDPALRARVTVHDPDFYTRLCLSGTLGAGEAWMDGLWGCDDLVGAVRLLLRNLPAMRRIEGGAARLADPARRALHFLRSNTRRGSRRNIAAHYDLGNDFFSLFLDPTLMYSSAIFEHPAASLEEAQRAKMDRIARKLQLGPDDHLLEIGSGWGGLAVHVARGTGCRVTTTTVSREQYELAGKRVAEAGLSERVTVLLQDYRDLRGEYDKLVSVEMIEAVGDRFLPDFFRVCAERLRSHGMALIQAITTPDQRYEDSRRRVDFIKRYIFPGGQLPSLQAMLTANARVGDLRLVHLEEIGLHYAETLRRWRASAQAARDRIRDLGYSDTFQRMWDFYLASCEGAFRERFVGDAQILLAKPGASGYGPAEEALG